MMDISKLLKKVLFGILLSISSIPFVSALDIAGSMDKGFNLIGDFFYITAFDNYIVQVGFIRIMLFVAMFAIMYAAFKSAGEKLKWMDNKTAKIVSFVFAMLGVFLMPEAWLMATGGAITALVSSIFYLMIMLGGGYIAVRSLRTNWATNLMGIVLILALIALVEVWANFVGLGIFLLIPKKYFERWNK